VRRIDGDGPQPVANAMAEPAPRPMALVPSSAEAAQAAEAMLRARYDFVPVAEAAP
jgi:hypothetical protein